MENKDFITYEYVTKVVKPQDQSMMIDIYESLGLEVCQHQSNFYSTSITFKRDRKIKHKTEFIKLQRKVEELLKVNEDLEHKKKTKGTVFSVIFGIISSLILEGGMSLVLLNPASLTSLVVGCALGVVGLVLCGVNYPIYKNITTKQTIKINPSIEENEEKIANTLQQANDLLSLD